MDNVIGLAGDSVDWCEGISKPSTQATALFNLRLGNLDVADLKLANGQWEFRYSEDFKLQTEIRPLVGFPDTHRIYRSETLWPFFVLRVPSLSQPAVQDYIRRSNDTRVDEVTLLRKFGRRSIANPFELISCATS